MFHRYWPTGLFVVLLIVSSVVVPPRVQAQAVRPAPPQEQSDAKPETDSGTHEVAGKRCLFIGHRFFIPVARMKKLDRKSVV